MRHVSCRYWLKGKCLNGDSCRWLHGIPTVEEIAAALADAVASAQSSTTDDFVEILRRAASETILVEESSGSAADTRS
jgi:hypothetical protein